MTIYFGLAFDDLTFPQAWALENNCNVLGVNGLLRFLESHLGLVSNDEDIEHLRVEQYRQALMQWVAGCEASFFTTSLAADPFATATELLTRRDELLLAGWDFQIDENCPERLKQLAGVEAIMNNAAKQPALSPGFSDRFIAVLKALPRRRQPITRLYTHENLEQLPGCFVRLIHALTAQGTRLTMLPPTTGQAPPDTDLGAFQQRLAGTGTPEKKKLKGDGSLLVLRGARESDLAAYTAGLLKRNPVFKPLILIPDKRRTLDDAIIQEGLPGLGILASSLARPTLQVLKLVTAFLWNPIDPFKIMEFVSLPIKPLEEELSRRIASQMAANPGINSEGWHLMIFRYFEDLNGAARSSAQLDIEAIRRQYAFWFERNRYDQSETAPKGDIIEIFAYLEKWAVEAFDNYGGRNPSLLIVSLQARRIRELLEALPEPVLSHLALERIVRTIYEAAPAQLHTTELGAPAMTQHPGAIFGEVSKLLWWNFTQGEPVHFFSRWYGPEREWLKARDVTLTDPEAENALLVWHRKRPILWTNDQLVITLPDTVEGAEAVPHPLWGDLEATFESILAIVQHIDPGATSQSWASHFTLPSFVTLEPRQLGRPRPFLRVADVHRLARREEETFSSLENLIYYPYQWVFKHQIKLSKSPILSVVKDNTLLGNLAHRFFELMLREDIQSWTKREVEHWIDQEAYGLLQREGIVLLMYGREPERLAFLNKVKHAAWSLVNLIQNNGWRVIQTEKPLEGMFMGDVSINGRADLVLEKNGEIAIVDLKWSGARRRQELIRNEEDLQLVLYSKLLTDDDTWGHTAYFIMENGKIIARNQLAFDEAVAVAADKDHNEANERILALIHATYSWRMNQIQQGLVEVRCEQTYRELEDYYGAELLSLLEMKKEDAYFDDYRTLINLIN